MNWKFSCNGYEPSLCCTASRVTRLWNPNQSCIYYVIEKSKGIKTIYGNVIFVSAIKSLCKKGIQYYTNEDHRVYRMWALELLTLKANLWFHAPFNNLNFYAIVLITILRLCSRVMSLSSLKNIKFMVPVILL
jgi:hypothetical protein